MTTTIDPGGSPVVIFNRSGVTIEEITAAGDNSQSAATPIARYCGWTIVVVASSGQAGVRLPSDAEIGDLVEIHCDSASNAVFVWPSTGDQIMYHGINNADTGVHILYRYISANNWIRVST